MTTTPIQSTNELRNDKIIIHYYYVYERQWQNDSYTRQGNFGKNIVKTGNEEK